MAQSFQVEVSNNTGQNFNVQVQNVSMGTGTFGTWDMQPQTTLSQIVGMQPSYTISDGSTGAISIQVQFSVGEQFKQVAKVEFDSTELTNFHQGVMFYGRNINISPGVPVAGTSNYLFATLHLGASADGSQTLGTVVILEAVGANPDLV